MRVKLPIDRFEGAKKQIAGLLTDDGTQINCPKALLPKGVNADDIVSISIEKDAQATKQVAEQILAVHDQLKKTASEDDIKLGDERFGCQGGDHDPLSRAARRGEVGSGRPERSLTEGGTAVVE